VVARRAMTKLWEPEPVGLGKHLVAKTFLFETDNDAARTELDRAAAVEAGGSVQVVDGPMLMPSEDMGRFLQRAPGAASSSGPAMRRRASSGITTTRAPT
jgi:metal-dependent amidase/aminoacylase/carboxypeptidase family protein